MYGSYSEKGLSCQIFWHPETDLCVASSLLIIFFRLRNHALFINTYMLLKIPLTSKGSQSKGFLEGKIPTSNPPGASELNSKNNLCFLFRWDHEHALFFFIHCSIFYSGLQFSNKIFQAIICFVIQSVEQSEVQSFSKGELFWEKYTEDFLSQLANIFE